MIALLLMAATADDAAFTRAALRLAPEQPCTADADTGDITVCGRRRADRFRVPFLAPTPGDPRHEAVAAERDRLLHRTTPIQDLSPFLVGGGMAGARMRFDNHGVRAETLRPLAP